MEAPKLMKSNIRPKPACNKPERDTANLSLFNLNAITSPTLSLIIEVMTP
jgi:hypothetical protein